MSTDLDSLDSLRAAAERVLDPMAHIHSTRAQRKADAIALATFVRDLLGREPFLTGKIDAVHMGGERDEKWCSHARGLAADLLRAADQAERGGDTGEG